MRSSPTWFVLAGLMLLLDFYVFQIIRFVSHSAGPKTKSIIFISYWVISLLSLLVLFLLPLFENFPRSVRSTVFAIAIGLFLCKLISAVFFLVDDLRRGIQWLAGKLFFRNTEGETIQGGEGMSRSVFLSWMGLAVGGGLFSSLIYGFSNKYNYKTRHIRLQYTNLPSAFKGIKIAQISDIHSGSFTDKAAVQKGVEKVLALQPDLILFTGDLVNNKADEMHPYMDVFGRLKAPLGIYSVLGNHDYGDYVAWTDTASKNQNLAQLKQVHQQMGWNLLLDENVLLARDN